MFVEMLLAMRATRATAILVTLTSAAMDRKRQPSPSKRERKDDHAYPPGITRVPSELIQKDQGRGEALPKEGRDGRLVKGNHDQNVSGRGESSSSELSESSSGTDTESSGNCTESSRSDIKETRQEVHAIKKAERVKRKALKEAERKKRKEAKREKRKALKEAARKMAKTRLRDEKKRRNKRNSDNAERRAGLVEGVAGGQGTDFQVLKI